MKLNVVRTEEQPWYAEGLSFQCTCSGNCCTGGPGFVWMDGAEVDRLAAHLGITREQTLKDYCRRIGRRISLKENRTPQGNYDCVFLKQLPAEKQKGKVSLPKRVCGIYPVRPLQCRTWPFWDGNLASRANWDASAKRCPGMNRGKQFTRGQIEDLRDATEWPAEGDAPGSKG